MDRTPTTTSSGDTASSNGVSITPSDSASIISMPSVDNQFQELAGQVGKIRLSEDVPLPSIEGSSTDSSGGANISRGPGTAHSRTPSLSLTPPPTNVSEDLRSGLAIRGAADSIDGRLGMSELADALEGVVRNSDGSGALLRPQSPAISDSSSSSRVSRRRSSSRTNLAPHNVMDEEPPNDRFHEPRFQQAVSDAKRVMSKLTDVLSSSTIRNEPDSTMRRLHEEAGNLAQFHCPSTRTVGFVGDSGVGKSSLLNSLLDFKGLARTSSKSNSGGACTCVVTEYNYHNTNDFAIEVEWFSIDEIHAQLTELLQSYRRYHLRGEDFDEQELEGFKKGANLAQHTFQAMFKGYLEDELFLTQSPEQNVIETLRSWANDICQSATSRREVYESLEDCATRLLQLTSEQESTHEPAKWPYIHKVRVFLNAHILSKGLVLVDLPGLRDLNLARRNITERYLLQCDEIFAVCYIGRATTDASVMSVFELAKKAELSNIGIVCTNSDRIEAEEAKNDWPGEKANTIERFLNAIAIDERDIEMIEAELRYYEDDDNELDEEDRVAELELGRRSKLVKKRKDQRKFELKQYLINTRNENVIQTLESLYRNTVTGNDLKVFCVSNSEYWEHRGSPKDYALPFLRLSGILSVRKHCISMVANSQLRIATKYLNDDIPVLLGDIELWVQSGAGSVDAERREEIRQTLNTVEARMKRELTGNSSRLSKIAKSFAEEFREHIFGRRRINDWTQAASNAGNVWSNEWSAATYKRFCQKYGDHRTEAVGKHNWNEEVIEEMANDLAPRWQELRSGMRNSLERDNEFIQYLMNCAIENIDTDLNDSSDSVVTLCQTLRSHQRLLLADLEQACEKFEDDLSTLRTDAFSGIRTSFIGRLMEQSYSRCNGEGGPGSDYRRKEIINNRLADETVFESLQTSFKSRFNTLAESLQSDIQAAVKAHLRVIINTLNIVRNENVALESERDPEYRGRVEREVRAVIHEICRLQGVISS